MSVNGIELAVGQQWLTTRGEKVTLQENPYGGTFVFRAVLENNEWSTVNREGELWSSDYKPYLQTIIYNPAQPKQFSPKPGDKIIRNNGEEFICCTLEFLHSKGLGTGVKDSDILGYRDSDHGRWMYWNKNGKVDEDDWHIKEIIPAQQEVKQEVTEVMKTTMQEKTYTLALIRNLFLEIVGRYDDGEEWNIGAVFKEVQEQLEGDYQQYLELKAKFEGKE